MSVQRFNFAEVSIKGVRKWADEAGRKRQQTRKFMQTLNPFNKNADGTLKTREQIMVELNAQRDAWMKEQTP